MKKIATIIMLIALFSVVTYNMNMEKITQNFHQKYVRELEKSCQNYDYDGFQINTRNKEDYFKFLDCLDWTKYKISLKQNNDIYIIKVEAK